MARDPRHLSPGPARRARASAQDGDHRPRRVLPVARPRAEARLQPLSRKRQPLLPGRCRNAARQRRQRDRSRRALTPSACWREHPEIEWRFANTGRGNPQIYYNEIPPEQISNVGQVYARFHEWHREEGMRKIEEIRARARSNIPARASICAASPTARRSKRRSPCAFAAPDLAALGEIADGSRAHRPRNARHARRLQPDGRAADRSRSQHRRREPPRCAACRPARSIRRCASPSAARRWRNSAIPPATPFLSCCARRARTRMPVVGARAALRLERPRRRDAARGDRAAHARERPRLDRPRAARTHGHRHAPTPSPAISSAA